MKEMKMEKKQEKEKENIMLLFFLKIASTLKCSIKKIKGFSFTTFFNKKG